MKRLVDSAYSGGFTYYHFPTGLSLRYINQLKIRLGDWILKRVAEEPPSELDAELLACFSK